MKVRDWAKCGVIAAGAFLLAALLLVSPTQAQGQKPNIVFIMGDDIGWSNVGVYNQGIMSGRTPNLDQLASEGMRFTDYYAEASCTAGRANFITGELPIRTGLTTVGQAGSPLGIPDEAPTIATALKSMGYSTGQFGKNHLGDLNRFLPTVHGFDEFFGYLYHLDAMEDPCHVNYPAPLKETVGPRHMIHSWATDADDQTVQPRWGKIGKQRIEDAGELCPKRMETVDDEILSLALKFIDKARADGKPFFLWLNPTRMHVVTHLSPKYQGMRNSDNNWSEEEAGMAQLDDIVGAVMKYLKDNGLEGNTIVGFTTDNGAENFTWPDGGQTPFAGGKGTALEGVERVTRSYCRFDCGRAFWRCYEVMEAHLEHIDRLNPIAHALRLRAERAELIGLARHRDAQLCRGEYLGWMHGLPTVIRENRDAARCALVARRMNNAGCIIIGEANQTLSVSDRESEYGWVAAPINAYDQRKTAGGDAAGAAVALALRMLPVADGSDPTVSL